MSALFNQTNIAPGTAFSGGGGSGSNFPNGLTIGTAPTGILDNTAINWNTTNLTLYGDNGSLAPFVAGSFISGDDTAPTFRTGTYSAAGILYQGSNGTGVSKGFLSVQDAVIGPNNNPFLLQGISSIVVGTSNLNMVALVSTLSSAFPGCIN